MWELGILAFGVLACGGAFWSSLRLNRRRLRGWREAAASCGLSVVEVSSALAWRLRLKAQAGPAAVRIEDSHKRDEGVWVTVAMPGPPGFPGVRICRQPRMPARRWREIEVGDEPFDATFWVEGPTRLLRVLLDAEMRRLLLELNAESRLEVYGGELRAMVYDYDLPHVLSLLLELGRRLGESVDAARRLAENARRDPQAGVRLQNLLLLARELGGEPATVETLRAACSDPSLQVRLRAAMALGAEGRDVLLELAHGTVDDAVSAQAVSSLGRELPLEQTRAILSRSLRGLRRLQTALSCLEVLGRHGGAAAVDPLAKVVAVERGELAAAAALALGATGEAAAEPPLLRALEREALEGRVRAAAASALGRIGSAAAVPPLKDAAERSRDRDLRRAARQAVAEIQSRLQGASPGQLSLAGAEVGQVSLADVEAGQLSLAADQAGQLSLPPGGPGRLSFSGAGEGLEPSPPRERVQGA